MAARVVDRSLSAAKRRESPVSVAGTGFASVSLMPLERPFDVRAVWCATVLATGLLACASVEEDVPMDDSPSEDGADSAQDAQYVDWMLQNAKFLGDLTSKTLVKDSSDCQYTASWDLLFCESGNNPNVNCPVSLNDGGVHSFTIPDLSSFNWMTLNIYSNVPLVACATGPSYAKCGQHFSTKNVYDGTTSYTTSISSRAGQNEKPDPSWRKISGLVIGSREAVVAKRVVEPKDYQSYNLHFTVARTKPASGQCPPFLPPAP
jgi:hypothetical protein